jgi:hypothetical protein
MEDIRLSAVAYQVDGLWIVQAIEYDIRARAYSRDEVVSAMHRAIQERVELNLHLGRQALEGVSAAPPEFAEMFKSASRVGAAPAKSKTDGQVEVVFA